jgi:hypothetical protein
MKKLRKLLGKLLAKQGMTQLRLGERLIGPSDPGVLREIQELELLYSKDPGEVSR